MPVHYIVRRTGQLLLIVWIAISINFLIPRLIPGDPIEAALSNKMIVEGAASTDIRAVTESYRAKFGFDKPIYTQYYNYWNDLFHGDLGVSLRNFPQPVISLIKGAIPWTLGLLVVSTVIAFALGSVLGALLAWPRAPRVLRALAPPLLVVSVIPYYLLALVLIYLLANLWQVFPSGGGFEPTRILGLNGASILDILDHSLLPALSIVLAGIGFWALGMRGMLISILGDDYMTFAEAKGLSPLRIFLRYGMRNAILPQVTQLGIALGFILSGAVLVEVIFNYPGLGNVLFIAIVGKDYFVIQGVVLMLILSLALSLFIVDLIYPLIDPRIRYARH